MNERPTFGSLFAGIGGIDLGLERAGWNGRWQVEYEPYCQRVLAKHWPDTTRYSDIYDVDWSAVEPVDLIAGGFPCQPFSNAGKRLGKDDVRWLWPEFARAVGALRPRYVLVENVPGLLAGHGGMGAVLGDLAALGYDAEWDSIPASAVGAPHLRYRVWIVGTKQRGPLADAGSGWGPGDGLQPGRDEPRSCGSDVADPVSDGGGRRAAAGGEAASGRARSASAGSGPQLGDVAHTNGLGRGRQAEVGQASLAGTRPQGAGPEPDGAGDGTEAVPDAHCCGRDGRASDARGPAIFGAAASGSGPGGGWDGDWLPEPDVGRVANGVPDRVHRLRALGNAVVPQVVEAIGRRILEAERLT